MFYTPYIQQACVYIHIYAYSPTVMHPSRFLPILQSPEFISPEHLRYSKCSINTICLLHSWKCSSEAHFQQWHFCPLSQQACPVPQATGSSVCFLSTKLCLSHFPQGSQNRWILGITLIAPAVPPCQSTLCMGSLLTGPSGKLWTASETSGILNSAKAVFFHSRKQIG